MFDWTKVDGYKEEMSAEEKLSLLENYNESAQDDALEKGDEKGKKDPVAPPKGFVLKSQLDKVSSELAAAKKQLRSRMTEEEQREAERLAEQDAIKRELEELRREKTLSTYKANYLSQGYDDTLASEAALAMVDGDTETVFDVMRRHAVITEKALRAKILKETPVPQASDVNIDERKKKEEEAALRRAFGLPPKP